LRQRAGATFQLLTPAQIERIKGLLASRWNTAYADAHGFGYYLDPRYMGAGMEKSNAEGYLVNLREKIAESAGVANKAAMYKELTAYTMEVNYMSKLQDSMLQCVREGTISVRDFINGMHTATYPNLKPFMLRVFAMSCTAVACERNWSAYNFIHSKSRNRLTNSRAQKLVYLYVNLRELSKSENKVCVLAEDNSDEECDRDLSAYSDDCHDNDFDNDDHDDDESE
jgi:hypothetical protein